MKKMLFVMNPFAGQRKANRYLAEILTMFNRADYDVTVYMTAGPGDGARMVKEKAADIPIQMAKYVNLTCEESLTLYTLLYKMLEPTREKEN